MTTPITLNDLPIGKTATVRTVGGQGALRQHFLDMGLIPNAAVTMVKRAPMGDPIEVRIKAYELTLRAAEAAEIEVVDVRDDAPSLTPNASTDGSDVLHPGFGEGGKYHVKTHENPLPEGTELTLVLAGNQNCGKTTLFNRLTGSNQHVGNFPGVTVDRKDGRIIGHDDTLVTDLPGIYSLSPYTNEEIISREFILKESPKAIINIVDATNIERNLYLTMQLMELDRPMVLALNMMDEVLANGGSIRINEMEALLGLPVVPIMAAKGEGINELVDHVLHVAKFQEPPAVQDFCGPEDHGGAVHRCLHGIMHIIEDHAKRAGIPVRFAASKIAEGDRLILEQLELDVNEERTIEHMLKQMEAERGLDRAAAMADMRFAFIDRICRSTVVRPHESKEHLRSLQIDRILTGKYTAIPAFIAIMALVFWLTFDVIGAWLQEILEVAIGWLTDIVDGLLTAWAVNSSIHGLLIDGVFNGVGSVLSFLPTIVTLFFFLSFLEDSGYMARVAFVMDTLLRKIGLSGRSKHRPDADRLRLHGPGRDGEPHPPLRARPQDDDSAHALHELFGEASDLRLLYGRLLPRNGRRDHGGALLPRDSHGGSPRLCDAKDPLQGRGRSLRDGTPELPHAGREERSLSPLGKGQGLFGARLHGDLCRDHRHLVPAVL